MIKPDPATNKEESIRIHLDWWGECLTCRHWTGDRTQTGNSEGTCASKDSDLGGQVTYQCGRCKWWDSFDPVTALEMLEKDMK